MTRLACTTCCSIEFKRKCCCQLGDETHPKQRRTHREIGKGTCDLKRGKRGRLDCVQTRYRGADLTLVEHLKICLRQSKYSRPLI